MSVRRSIVLGFAVAVLLAGCQGTPEPKVEPTASESSSEADPSEQPEPQTAEEFIDEWFAVNTAMQNSGETDEFRAMSPHCRPCNRLADQVTGFYDAGGFVRIKDQEVQNVKALSRTEFLVTVDAAPTEYRESADAELERLGGGPTEYRMILKRAEEGWVVAHYYDSTSA
jgi:hypothetical protein